MGIGTWFDRLFEASASSSAATGHDGLVNAGSVNPATLLPMVGDVDVMGNPCGVDLNSSHHWDHHHGGGFLDHNRG